MPAPFRSLVLGHGAHRAAVAAAIAAAQQACGGPAAGCRVVSTTTDRCAAYAESRQGGYWHAAGGGPDVGTARAHALEFCQSGTAPAGSRQVAASSCGP